MSDQAAHLDPEIHKTYVIEGSIISAEGSLADRAGQLLNPAEEGASRIGTEIVLPAQELPENTLEWRIAERFRKANPMARYNEHTAGSLFDVASRACIKGEELQVNIYEIDLEEEVEKDAVGMDTFAC